MKRIIKKLLGQKTIEYFKFIRLIYFTKDKKEIINARKFFYSSFIKKGEFCFDVGANIGNRIEPLLQIGARVLAVEPQKRCYDYLSSKYANRIILITKGLSDTEGVKNFYISSESAISSFSEEWINTVRAGRFKQFDWNRVVETEMTTLDRLIKEHGVPVFIKIDVEGYELEVLKGLSTPVKLISFEYTAPEYNGKAIECINYMKDLIIILNVIILFRKV
ncbi:MAG: FkbM family methyltransferase [Ferruginibacter sp.]